jgi:hypothetical protein
VTHQPVTEVPDPVSASVAPEKVSGGKDGDDSSNRDSELVAGLGAAVVAATQGARPSPSTTARARRARREAQP